MASPHGGGGAAGSGCRPPGGGLGGRCAVTGRGWHGGADFPLHTASGEVRVHPAARPPAPAALQQYVRFYGPRYDAVDAVCKAIAVESECAPRVNCCVSCCVKIWNTCSQKGRAFLTECMYLWIDVWAEDASRLRAYIPLSPRLFPGHPSLVQQVAWDRRGCYLACLCEGSHLLVRTDPLACTPVGSQPHNPTRGSWPSPFPIRRALFCTTSAPSIAPRRA